MRTVLYLAYSDPI